MNTPAPLALSVPAAARMMGIGKSLAWELISRGELPAARVAGRTLVRVADVEAFLALRVKMENARPALARGTGR